MIVKGDKTSNHYSVDKHEYQNVLHNTITGEYKKAPQEKEAEVTKVDKKIATNLNIADRAEVMPKSEAYFTYKHHKPGSQNKRSVRLINPNKSNMGKVSKKILQEINNELRSKLKYEQWRSTNDALSWFKRLENTNRATFIIFDITFLLTTTK